ncbi:hypothetical protein EV207_11264 [Scopulibacillus darangshiensis]|uniref:DhaL domain-containing protein n=1 Tax=Scopulibacillus darangshiensis TaxID=442528 RepID=A0A4R2P312_9BACL|nr:DAK2 domain-containing protein [Scopulibacillus darangshiensis]TCP29139.1 hypothetical protein EV207_11264 [Scopulibacillus darangshiensis]
MTIETINCQRFMQMLKEGANKLSEHAKTINTLNVFPVPDGDTGTNMTLTMKSGIDHLVKGNSGVVGGAATQFARGLLMGARGNSGVILSQLFRGFSKTLEPHDYMTADLFSKALDAGVETAYKAVMKPVEGTILTVAKDSAKAAVKKARKTKDLSLVVEAALVEAKRSLQRTPELLPVLKEVGVVDSGGQGLVMIYQGFFSGLTGEAIPFESEELPKMDDLIHAEHHRGAQGHMKTEDIKYGYCTEFMVRLNKTKDLDEADLKERLAKAGDSLVVVSDDDLLKVHVHTEKPGDMLTLGQNFGELVKIKVDNMREQHSGILQEDDQPQVSHKPSPSSRKRRFGVVTVAMGQGVKALFESIGATVVIEGGQTMNPSTEDLLKAIDKANAETVFVLPNNSNIVMAAEQAAKVSDSVVHVLRSKTIAQGLSALLSFNPEASDENNRQVMDSALRQVKSGQVTTAIRDAAVDGVPIRKNDFIGIAEGKIIVSASDRMEAVNTLVSGMIENDNEIVTLIFGENVTKREAQKARKMISEKYEDIEVELQEGLQPIYDYFISVE